MKRTRKEEWAWAAGIYEGEGCLSSRKSLRRYRRDRGLVLKLKMTDKDVMRHFVKVVGEGHLLGPYKKVNRKPVWIWQTGRYKTIRRILREFQPWLHSRRRQQIQIAYQRYRAWGGYKH